MVLAEKTMPFRPLGREGLVVAAQGLGTMGMTALYTTGMTLHTRDMAAREAESLATIAAYVAACAPGKAFVDTAWVYKKSDNTVHSETLVGKAIAAHGRDRFIIATKCGIDFSNPSTPFDASESAVRKQLSESLLRLGTTYVDLYYQHRQDPATPIETVAATFKKLHAEGLIKYIGFSEVTGDELRRAHAVFPVSAVEQEWSLATRDLEDDLVPVARELGIGIVAYAPLGRGLLSGRFTSRDDFAAGDARLTLPRFSPENLASNVAVAAKIAAVAQRKGVTPAQLALAWVHGRGDDVFPIPGTKSVQRLHENLAALHIHLTPEETNEIEAAAAALKGNRYAAGSMNSAFSAK